jgi:hypothetical protein
VAREGIEPSTFRFSVGRSDQLSYLANKFGSLQIKRPSPKSVVSHYGTYPSRFGAKNDFSFLPGLSEEAKAEHLSKNTKIQKWKEAQVRQWGGEFGHRSQFTREKGGMHSIMTTATATAKSPFSQSEQDSIVAGEWAPDPNEIEEDGKASGETKSSR